MMKQITNDEYEILQQFILRQEEMHDYIYAVGVDPKGYFTISRYHEMTTIKEIPEIEMDVMMNQDKADFVNNHAVIHIDADKNIHLWRE